MSLARRDQQRYLQSLSREQQVIELAKITIEIIDYYMADYTFYAIQSHLTDIELNDALTVYAPLLRNFIQESQTEVINDAGKLDNVVIWCELIMHTNKATNKHEKIIPLESESERFKRNNSSIDNSLPLIHEFSTQIFLESKNKQLHLNSKPHEIKKTHLPSYSQHHQFFSSHGGKKPDLRSRREIKQPSSFKR